jgi:hypothetical protein
MEERSIIHEVPSQTIPSDTPLSSLQEDANKTLTAPLNDTKASYRKNAVFIIVLQVVIVVVLFGMATTYGIQHHAKLGILSLLSGPDPEEIANFNFVGVTPSNPDPSFIAVMIEAMMWSLAGVLARHLYDLTQIIIKRNLVDPLETISRLIGESSMGVAIAMAVVAFLQTVQIANLTLKGAGIESVGAISFILGFYHESARGLLKGFQKRLSQANKDDQESAAE